MRESGIGSASRSGRVTRWLLHSPAPRMLLARPVQKLPLFHCLQDLFQDSVPASLEKDLRMLKVPGMVHS